MYLRRIEIQGFKSFAARTTLEFGPGMTTIVGPNGSGKSNVIDALRWVLGEQSTRSLRAKRMDDVIFAGSSKRPSLGMAEVSVTLDNADAWLPIDFAEVVITRRAYRSGEAEYLINRNRVRLRDVLDLLLKANVAQDSYAVMGQAMVEEVLTLRAEDRRVLLEEAAGVRPFRVRMDEARDRLAATRENLERVTMLIAEIAPRLAHLERQAERAEENAKFARELSQALQAWYGQQWDHAQEALVAAGAHLDQAREESRAAREVVQTQEQGIAALRDELDGVRAEVTARDENVRRLSAELREIERTVAVENERRGLLTVRREEIERDIEALQRDLAQQTSYAGEDADRRKALEQELQVANATLAQHQAELDAFESNWRDARDGAAEAQERAARAAAAAAEIEHRLQQDAGERQRLTAETERLTARKADLDTDLAAIAEDEARLAGEEERLSAGLTEAIRQHESLKRLILEAQHALKTLDERDRAASRDLALSESRYEAIRAAQEERDAIEAGLRHLAQPDGQLAGIIGMVTSLIQVPRGMERAIEAALAEHLRAVVVDRPESAIAAIQALMDEDKGNVTIIPLQGLREVSPLNLFKEKGVVGVASKLVRCDGKYRKLFDTLLGRTVLVDDVRTGREVLKRGLGTVVTMDGVLMRPVGSVTLGPGKAIESQFDRDMQLRELPARIEGLQQDIASVATDLESKRQAVDANESAITMIGQKIDGLRSARAAKLDDLTALRGKLAQLRGEMRWIVEAQHQNRERIGALETSEQGLAQEREALLARAEDTAAAARQRSAAVASLQQQRETLLRAVSDASAHAASLTGEQKSIAHLREKQESATSRIEAQIAAKRMQARQIEAEMSAAEAHHAHASARLVEVRASEEAERTALDPLRTRRDTTEDQLALLREDHSRSRQRLIVKERDEQEAIAGVERRETEIEELREAIRAEGLEITDLGDVVAQAPAAVAANGDVPDYLRLAASPGARLPEAHGELPPVAGGARADSVALKERIAELRGAIRNLGPVNQEAVADYEENRERHDFLTGQVKDMEDSEVSLRAAIAELEEIIRERFRHTFDLVADEFERYFTLFFAGGKAQLLLTPPEDYATSGIEIVAQPPGKKLQSLALLSGGERALTAVALLFALLRVHPVPFVVLDEVDAALDEANVGRFADALLELTANTQFIVVTHNRRTIERSDTIYGVSMGDDNVSRLLSMRLSDLPPDLN